MIRHVFFYMFFFLSLLICCVFRFLVWCPSLFFRMARHTFCYVHDACTVRFSQPYAAKGGVLYSTPPAVPVSFILLRHTLSSSGSLLVACELQVRAPMNPTRHSQRRHMLLWIEARFQLISAHGCVPSREAQRVLASLYVPDCARGARRQLMSGLSSLARRFCCA